MSYEIVGEGGSGGGGGNPGTGRDELEELVRAAAEAAAQGALAAARAAEQYGGGQENSQPGFSLPEYRSLKQRNPLEIGAAWRNMFTRGGGTRGGGASRGRSYGQTDPGGYSDPRAERQKQEIQLAREEGVRKWEEYRRRRTEEERLKRASNDASGFDSFTAGGGTRGGGAGRGSGEEEASPFTRGGGTRGGGARRDPQNQGQEAQTSGAGAEEERWRAIQNLLRAAEEGAKIGERLPAKQDSGDEHGEGDAPRRRTETGAQDRTEEEEPEEQKKGFFLPPVLELMTKAAGTAGMIGAGVQAAGAAGRIAETFLRPKGVSDWDWSWRLGEAEGAKTDLEKSAALYDVGKTKLEVANRISEELGRKVVFDGTLPVDKTGVIDPETGTIRLNSRVGGPENLRDNAMQLVQEESAGLDSAGSGGYNAGERVGPQEFKGRSEIDTLTNAQKSRLKSLDNTINDHLTDDDFSGTLRDLQGNPVPNGNGGYFDHLGEMKNSYKSLLKNQRGLEGSLRNPNLSKTDRLLLQEGLDKVNLYISKIEKLFKPFGGIF